MMNKIIRQQQLCDWLSYRQKTLANYLFIYLFIYLLFSLRIHGYLTQYIYLGKVRSHTLTQFPALKGSFATVKVSRVTAPYNHYFRKG